MTDKLKRLNEQDQSKDLTVQDIFLATEDFTDVEWKEVINVLEDDMWDIFQGHVDQIFSELSTRIEDFDELTSQDIELLQLCGFMKQKFEGITYGYEGEESEKISIDGKVGKQTNALLKSIVPYYQEYMEVKNNNSYNMKIQILKKYSKSDISKFFGDQAENILAIKDELKEKISIASGKKQKDIIQDITEIYSTQEIQEYFCDYEGLIYGYQAEKNKEQQESLSKYDKTLDILNQYFQDESFTLTSDVTHEEYRDTYPDQSSMMDEHMMVAESTGVNNMYVQESFHKPGYKKNESYVQVNKDYNLSSIPSDVVRLTLNGGESFVVKIDEVLQQELIQRKKNKKSIVLRNTSDNQTESHNKYFGFQNGYELSTNNFSIIDQEENGTLLVKDWTGKTLKKIGPEESMNAIVVESGIQNHLANNADIKAMRYSMEEMQTKIKPLEDIMAEFQEGGIFSHRSSEKSAKETKDIGVDEQELERARVQAKVFEQNGLVYFESQVPYWKEQKKALEKMLSDIEEDSPLVGVQRQIKQMIVGYDNIIEQCEPGKDGESPLRKFTNIFLNPAQFYRNDGASGASLLKWVQVNGPAIVGAVVGTALIFSGVGSGAGVGLWTVALGTTVGMGLGKGLQMASNQNPFWNESIEVHGKKVTLDFDNPTNVELYWRGKISKTQLASSMLQEFATQFVMQLVFMKGIQGATKYIHSHIASYPNGSVSKMRRIIKPSFVENVTKGAKYGKSFGGNVIMESFQEFGEELAEEAIEAKSKTAGLGTLAVFLFGLYTSISPRSARGEKFNFFQDNNLVQVGEVSMSGNVALQKLETPSLVQSQEVIDFYAKEGFDVVEKSDKGIVFEKKAKNEKDQKEGIQRVEIREKNNVFSEEAKEITTLSKLRYADIKQTIDTAKDTSVEFLKNLKQQTGVVLRDLKSGVIFESGEVGRVAQKNFLECMSNLCKVGVVSGLSWVPPFVFVPGSSALVLFLTQNQKTLKKFLGCTFEAIYNNEYFSGKISRLQFTRADVQKNSQLRTQGTEVVRTQLQTLAKEKGIDGDLQLSQEQMSLVQQAHEVGGKMGDLTFSEVKERRVFLEKAFLGHPRMKDMIRLCMESGICGIFDFFKKDTSPKTKKEVVNSPKSKVKINNKDAFINKTSSSGKPKVTINKPKETVDSNIDLSEYLHGHALVNGIEYQRAHGIAIPLCVPASSINLANYLGIEMYQDIIELMESVGKNDLPNMPFAGGLSVYVVLNRIMEVQESFSGTGGVVEAKPKEISARLLDGKSYETFALHTVSSQGIDGYIPRNHNTLLIENPDNSNEMMFLDYERGSQGKIISKAKVAELIDSGALSHGALYSKGEKDIVSDTVTREKQKFEWERVKENLSTSSLNVGQVKDILRHYDIHYDTLDAQKQTELLGLLIHVHQHVGNHFQGYLPLEKTGGLEIPQLTKLGMGMKLYELKAMGDMLGIDDSLVSRISKDLIRSGVCGVIEDDSQLKQDKFNKIKDLFLEKIINFSGDIDNKLNDNSVDDVLKTILYFQESVSYVNMMIDSIGLVDAVDERNAGIELKESFINDAMGIIFSSLSEIHYSDQFYLIGKLLNRIEFEDMSNIETKIDQLILDDINDLELYVRKIGSISSISKDYIFDELSYLLSRSQSIGGSSEHVLNKCNEIREIVRKKENLELGLSNETKKLVSKFPVLLHYSHVIPDFSNLEYDDIINPDEGSNGLLILINDGKKVLKIPRSILGDEEVNKTLRVNVLHQELSNHNLIEKQNIKTNIHIPKLDVSNKNNFAPYLVMDFVGGYTISNRFFYTILPALHFDDLFNSNLKQSKVKEIVADVADGESKKNLDDIVYSFGADFKKQMREQELEEYINSDLGRDGVFQLFVLSKINTSQNLQRQNKYIELIRLLKKYKENGIIVEDRNQGNIMVDPATGEMTLIDFGNLQIIDG